VLADAASRREWGDFVAALGPWLRQQGRAVGPGLQGGFLLPH